MANMEYSSATLSFSLIETPQQLNLQLSGALTRFSLPELNKAFQAALSSKNLAKLSVSTQGITHWDTAGLIQLKECIKNAQKLILCTLEPLPTQLQSLWSMVSDEALRQDVIPEEPTLKGFAGLGQIVMQFFSNVKLSLQYTGEIVACFGSFLRHPKSLDLKKVLFYIQDVGPNSIPLTFLIGILFGLIMAFQSAGLLKSFGAEIYVANLVSVALVKELGPLLMAIILTGRIASAYAAEISVMQVNQEIDALKVMGLNPIPYLVLPRLIATALIAPFIALFMDFFGLLGCGLVMHGEGFSRNVIIEQMFIFLSFGDFISSLIKSMIFGVLIAGIGCFQGLNSEKNATAVGAATTQTMVMCIVIVTSTDGLFTTLLFYMGL
ncbi:MAG: ABC transporter permease [Gammaproteobacteria bacterium]|nr:ABC transporter permease [Gammaproteobacteria bacterium]